MNPCTMPCCLFTSSSPALLSHACPCGSWQRSLLALLQRPRHPPASLVEALLLQGALLPSPSLGSPAEERGCVHKAVTALPLRPASVMPPFLQPLPWCKPSPPTGTPPTASATQASFLPFQPIPLLLPQGLCTFWPVCLKSSASLSGYSLCCAWGDVYAPQSPELCFLVSCWSHFLSYSELIPFFLKFYLSISLVPLGLRCCSQALHSCSEWGLLSLCSLRAFYCGGFSCCGALTSCAKASVLAAHRLSRCGPRALGCRLCS